jgi:hypothetical protein
MRLGWKINYQKLFLSAGGAVRVIVSFLPESPERDSGVDTNLGALSSITQSLAIRLGW